MAVSADILESRRLSCPKRPFFVPPNEFSSENRFIKRCEALQPSFSSLTSPTGWGGINLSVVQCSVDCTVEIPTLKNRTVIERVFCTFWGLGRWDASELIRVP